MHGLDEQLKVLDARVGRDAMPEVEDVSQPSVGAAQDVDRARADHAGRPKQHSRVEVALQAAFEPDALPPLIEVDAPVERHDVRAGRGDELEQSGRAGADRKSTRLNSSL